MVKYKILFYNKHVPRTQIQPILRAKDELEKRGYYWVSHDEDVTLFQGRLLNLLPLDEWIKQEKIESPIIILDQSDSAIFGYLGLINHRQVIGYIKKQLLVDRDLYNYDYVDNRYHLYLYAQTRKDADNYKPIKSPKNIPWEKIHLGWNLANCQMIQKTFEIPISHRDIDIHCSMRTNNNGNLLYEHHRKECIRHAIEVGSRLNLKLSGKVQGRTYLNAMARSRIVINAWGLGEICIRHFEAAALKCVSVSPPMGHVDTWPNIFIDGYVPCAADYSNLGKIINDIIKHPDNYQPAVELAYNKVVEANQNDVFADYFINIMQRILK